MSNFPRNSAFSQQPGRAIPGYPPEPNLPVGSTKRLSSTEVPVNRLEDWYRRLDDLAIEVEQKGLHTKLAGLPGPDLRDLLADLRDEVYAYLRG